MVLSISDSPSQSPNEISWIRSSVRIGIFLPSVIHSAVCNALCKGLEITRSIGISFIPIPVSFASLMPSSASGISVCPCSRLTLFHAVSHALSHIRSFFRFLVCFIFFQLCNILLTEHSQWHIFLLNISDFHLLIGIKRNRHIFISI